MATAKAIVREAHGVTLTEVALHGGEEIVAKAYVVATLRTPETWSFTSLAEADARYLHEVGINEKTPPL